MDMILTGRMMDAEEAERAGLASRVDFPADNACSTRPWPWPPRSPPSRPWLSR